MLFQQNACCSFVVDLFPKWPNCLKLKVNGESFGDVACWNRNRIANQTKRREREKLIRIIELNQVEIRVRNR